MRDLTAPMRMKLRALVDADVDQYGPVTDLLNAVVTDQTDAEHVITFLAESPSSVHRKFAAELRSAFEDVLKDRLVATERELGPDRFRLYSAFLDMYNAPCHTEELRGLLTLNYDDFLDAAIDHVFDVPADYGLELHGHTPQKDGVPLLKLHGSFDWTDTWPVYVEQTETPLWIPPGIQKRKDRYPFNAVWGLARELLDCDVLRIVGCRLSSNDWDLLSLIFNTRHAHVAQAPYRIEVIDSPASAIQMQADYPYLEVRSLFEINGLGEELVAEYQEDSPPRPYAALTDDEKAQLAAKTAKVEENWFLLWLHHLAEDYSSEFGQASVETPKGEFKRLLEI